MERRPRKAPTKNAWRRETALTANKLRVQNLRSQAKHYATLATTASQFQSVYLARSFDTKAYVAVMCCEYVNSSTSPHEETSSYCCTSYIVNINIDTVVLYVLRRSGGKQVIKALLVRPLGNKYVRIATSPATQSMDGCESSVEIFQTHVPQRGILHT